MLAEDFTFQFMEDGFVLNTDASPTEPFVDVIRVDGLDNVDFRTSEHQHEGMDGGFLDAEYETLRTIVIDGTLYSPSELAEETLDILKANYGPSKISHPFYFRAPGVGERIVFAKSLGARYSWEQLRRTGKTAIQFQLKAEDPAIYGPVKLATLSIAVAATGRGYNKSYNYGYGSSGEGDAGGTNAYNDGKKETGALIRISGPVIDPVILHDNTGRYLEFGIELTEGQYLDVDLRNKTVTLNGSSNRRNALRGGSRWFMLQPGDNFLRYLGDGDPPSVSVTYRSAYR